MKGISNARVKARVALAVVGLAAFSFGCRTDRSIAPQPSVIVAGPDLSAVPVKPNFNLEVILRPTGDGDGFGHVTFRQNNDDATIIDLGVWVRDLSPDTHYRLQRAVDTALDDACTSQTWLTLGLGAVAQDIVTDERGTGRADLFRVLTNAPGSAFDIHFRIITATAVPTVVLESECYQFFVR